MKEIVVLAGGGTGGHLVPAMALASAVELAGRRPVLVTGDRPIEDRVLAGATWERRRLRVRGFATAGWLGRLQSLRSLPGAVLTAWRWIRQWRPALIVLTGGYVALPVGLAARLAGRPFVLVEPNCIPGRTTRLLARMASMVVLLDKTVTLPGRAARLGGMPVREAIVALGRRERLPGDGRLLVLGGSQGARALNLGVPAALPTDYSGRILHVAGPGRADEARSAYAERGIDAEIVEYLDDMAGALAAADLVVARAGAGTIAELIAATVPAVLVPYPHAADGHQEANARLFARLGGGMVVGEGAEFEQRLAAAIRSMRGANAGAAHDRLREGELVTDARRLIDALEGGVR
jgi:UDP-N-acetylglucosamine--N-acetylmuramyl-(pentapeptide) pyrophosphoryl-undecaprenol N-acetylglucosamine transferase